MHRLWMMMTPLWCPCAATNARTPKTGVQNLLTEHGETVIHCAVAMWCMRGAVQSVNADEWAAIRMRPPEQQADSLRARIFKRRRRAAKVGQFLGAGYTPRIVFLAGLMLRSLQMSTRVQDAFDPSLGYAAGATLAASFSQREWIPCILLGCAALDHSSSLSPRILRAPLAHPEVDRVSPLQLGHRRPLLVTIPSAATWG
jgi:hypothetical protein